MGSQLQADMPIPAKVERPGVILAAIAAGIAFAMDIVYLIVIRNQGDGMGIRVLVVASFIAAAGACAVGAVRSPSPERRIVLMAAAAGGLTSLGILGMFSIGLPLLIAGVLATIGAVRSLRSQDDGGSRLPALTAGIFGFLLPVAILFTPR